MERFKFTEKNLKQAVEYLKNKTGSPPRFLTKFKEQIKLEGNKLLYNDREVIPREKQDSVLRKEFYGKKSTIPYGRDSAFHALKQRYVGLPKNKIMEFIRKQQTLGKITAALNKPKRTGGRRLKEPTFEVDLVFLRKNDLEKANKKFIRDEIKNETYFLTCVEKTTGLCNFAYVQTKQQKIVSKLVIENCQKIADKIGLKLKECAIANDRGDEFNMKLFKSKFKTAEYVSMGPKVEQTNRHFQANFFKILRQRKATTIIDAMKQSEALLNNTYNKYHKLTPNEVATKDTDETVKAYNRTRKSFIAGDKRKEFEVNQHVRIQIKEKKPGIGYKTYKGKTFSDQVYIIKNKTKKAIPAKYRVDGIWRLQADLLKSAPRDKISNELVQQRDDENRKKAFDDRQDHLKQRREEIEKEEKEAQEAQDAKEIQEAKEAKEAEAKAKVKAKVKAKAKAEAKAKAKAALLKKEIEKAKVKKPAPAPAPIKKPPPVKKAPAPIKKVKKKKKAPVLGRRRSLRQTTAKAAKLKMLEEKEKYERIDDLLDEIEEEDERSWVNKKKRKK